MFRKFIHELRHRKVLRTAFGYAVFVFAAIEAIDIVTPLFGLPEGFLANAILVALAGLPIVMILAWNFDWSSDGVTIGTPAPPRQGGHRGQIISWILILLLGVAVTYLTLRLYGETGQRSSFGAKTESGATLKYGMSVAVLPFVNISVAGENDNYFSDGVAQEILSALAGVQGLRVAARSSSFGFRDDAANLLSIGEALQVSVVLEGTVRRDGDQLRVNAQLADTSTGFQIWSDSFDYTRADVFKVQEEIARSIVTALKLELGGEAENPMIQPGTESIAAYELYLKGRHLINARRLASSREAVKLFEEAIEIDRGYAQAYAGLADAWISIREIGDLSLFEATQRSHDAITQALQINAQLPEAQTSLGLCILGGGDKSEALQQFDRAISLDPAYVDAHLWRANTLRDQGNLSAATRAYSQALALDPLNPSILEGQALLNAYQGRFERAIAQLGEVTTTHPARVATSLMRGRIALLAGDYDGALSAADQAGALAPNDAVVLALRVDALTRLSRVDAARASLDRAITLAAENEIVLVTALNFHFLSGDYEALEAATETRARLVLANAGFEGTDMYRERLLWAAIAKLALGQATQARDLLEKALPDSDGLYLTPSSVHSLALLVRARFLTGDLVGAASAADSARTVAERARLEGCAPAALDYALAAVAAAAEDYSLAAVHFQSAVGAGWQDLVYVTHDPAVAGFRNTREYRELVESVSLRRAASESD